MHGLHAIGLIGTPQGGRCGDGTGGFIGSPRRVLGVGYLAALLRAASTDSFFHLLDKHMPTAGARAMVFLFNSRTVGLEGSAKAWPPTAGIALLNETSNPL